ncbi:MAG: amidohydrolase family protein [Janthinobacterium lividum]
MDTPMLRSAGLCDSHIHVVGDAACHPQAATRTYTPGIALLPTLERHAVLLGVTRFVIVQPSFYGTDNTLLLEALDVLAGRGRGVAVIDPDRTSGEHLADLARRGVRGLRVNLYSTLSGQEECILDRAFDAVAQVARTQDWHVEVIAPIAMLAEASALLARSPVPVVIDHYGLHEGSAPGSLVGRGLLGLLRLPHVWMKLSAPYRASADALAVRPDPVWLAAILEAGADRCVWGSDWPHTPPHELQTGAGVPLPYRALDYPAVLEGFRAALPAGTLAERILRDNPARLYGFEAGA